MSERASQAGIFAEARAALSLELDFASGDVRAALEKLAAIADDRTVIGVGTPLAPRVPGLVPLAPMKGKASLAAKQHALWIFAGADTPGEAFERAEALVRAASPELVVAESTSLFRYRDGRDLTGYVDGIGNPKDPKSVALVREGPLAGGSFAFVQRFVHDRSAFFALSRREQDDVIGRTYADAREMADAPATSHVKRTDQESFDPPAFIYRKSMPWGDPANNGLQFIAFTDELSKIDAMLRRMTGADDGIADALLRYTRAVTGGYYFCPPTRDGKLDVRAIL